MSQLERSLKATTLSETLSTYNEWANTYNQDVAKEEYVAPQLASQELIAHLGTQISSAKILDAGCGTGFVGEALTKLGAANIHGIDLSPGMLQIAQRCEFG
ncbi:Williams-Beuren syndrome chromosomal region 27 protein [Fusarium bulbicola]|nr:Williams-Beuren syndrome chromosomal region 27 protein [Fusarium bulbicola]